MIIGKVYATADTPSTPTGFYFWTKDTGLLNPFDIIKAGDGADAAYAVVERISHTSDSPDLLTEYLSNGMGDPYVSSDVKRIKMTSVWARLLGRFDDNGDLRDDLSPVPAGTEVQICNKEEIIKALNMPEHGIPVGSVSMYNTNQTVTVPLKVDIRYITGPDGAHLNVSGVSGLAAKTSYLMFLLNSIRQNDKNDDTAFIIFNVKGMDLMSIDKKSADEDKEKHYKDLGLEAEPIGKVKYFVPGGKKGDKEGAIEYVFTLDECKDELKFFFESDESGTMESCCSFVLNKLKDGSIKNWGNLVNPSDEHKWAEDINDYGIQDRSWNKFMRVLKPRIENNKLFDNNDLSENVKNLKDLSNYIMYNLKGGETMVIDVEPLDNNIQSFVFGTVLQAAEWLKEKKCPRNGKEDAVPSKIIIFFDELNKYVSSDSNFPALKNLLLEITERGRSLGLILFGAEQFLSAIHPRIKGNCATFVYGRTPVSELAASDYSGLPETYRNMIPSLSPGQMIFSNASLRAPVRIRFPKEVFEREKPRYVLSTCRTARTCPPALVV